MYLDTDLYEEFYSGYKPLGPIRAFGTQSEEKSDQRMQFLRGEVRNPTLHYQKLEQYDIESARKHLTAFRSSLDSKNPIEKLYIVAVEEKLLDVELLSSSKENDMERFLEANIKKYGVISEELWHYSLAQFLKSIETATPTRRESLGRVVRQIGIPYDGDKAKRVRELLEKPIPVQIKERVRQSSIVSINLDDEREYQPEEITEILKEALTKYNIEGWSIQIDQNIEGMTVRYKKKKYLIPDRSYTGKLLKRLIPHEIGVHILRTDRAESSPLLLIQNGMLRGTEEEGMAKIVELVADDNLSDPCRGIFLTGLIVGIDGIKRDFRDMYELLLCLLDEDSVYSTDDFTIEDRAWNRCIKLFRGTNWNTPGVCFFRNKEYSEKMYCVLDILYNRSLSFDEMISPAVDFTKENLREMAITAEEFALSQ